MAKTTTVRALMAPEKKEKVGEILKRLGMNHSDAINILYSLIEEFQGFPFHLKLPDEKTISDTDATLRPEVLSSLKESIKKNRRLGELLAK